MKVVVYVEGPSDRAAMLALLAPLLEQKKQEGISIDFFESPEGDKKASVLTKVPKRAAIIIRNDPSAIVVAMPDLYPKNKGFVHETFKELEAGILKNFADALQAKGRAIDARLRKRLKVFCFKHDLEALLLAAKEALGYRLGASSLKVTWKIPVEDQNHGRPPKRIVEELFAQYSKSYRDTVDAPVILGASKYQDIADQCPQCFKPFVQFLASL
jgi:hypothetical protein